MSSTPSCSLSPNSLNLVVGATADVPLSLLKSGQLLRLTPNSQGGLLIQKEFYVDYVGAGAAVGGCFDVDSQAVYVLGAIEFSAPQSYEERAAAFRKRIVYSQMLQAIAAEPSPLRRAQRIIAWLSKRFGLAEVARIPPDLIARLVGLQPTTVTLFWQHYRKGKRRK